MAVSVGVFLGSLVTVSVIVLLFAAWLNRWVMRHDEGGPKLLEVAIPIQEASASFIRTQYGTIGTLLLVTTVAVFFGTLKNSFSFALMTSFAFLTGGVCSALSGSIAMYMSVRANVRVTAAACRKSYREPILIAFRGGMFASLLILSLCLFGLVSMFSVVYVFMDVPVSKVGYLLVGFGFGASFVSLFAQLGGGIFTKAADVGADIVGKVEAGIPEDDPRNPATIADNVGDNVGDCAGRGADLFESVASENIGAMILGSSLARTAGMGLETEITYTLLPLALFAAGLLCTIIGCFFVDTDELDEQGNAGERTSLIERGGAEDFLAYYEDPMKVLQRGFTATFSCCLVALWIVCYVLLRSDVAPRAWFHFALCGTIGLITSLLFVYYAIYYTDYAYPPTRRVAEASTTGAGTNVIMGTSVGMESTALPGVSMCVAILSSYYLGRSAGFDSRFSAGIFGTAMATLGMLLSAAYILSMDVFGPISDNAGGIAEMSHQPADVRAVIDRLDSVGNSTKALTKGYAVGSAGLAAFLILFAYIDSVNEVLPEGMQLTFVDITTPEIFVAALLGAILIYLFSSISMRAVGETASVVVREVRHQFATNPGILQRTSKPDYARVVHMVVVHSLHQMILPGILVVVAPLVVGLTFRMIGAMTDRPLLGPQALAAFVLVGTITGLLMALYLNNAGGSWDNAKKYVETGNYGGKGSEAHKAAVVGDTVGDPFKDTTGPSIHVVIKIISNITLVFGTLFVAYKVQL
eukprot:CAMPEP_0184706970 /NCGR_PEP_ID=MMETSP0313-20130426/37028_1 /TAXON_ID=2792 /ORGANISM="Porphyridium aerugineum, Strain SAG 1380-2" /LENGTH=751 /DNA_ID=CAMNT_0027168539 /DNA_START=146 /DNA_END=2401 /DNA_ORIENTATION=+